MRAIRSSLLIVLCAAAVAARATPAAAQYHHLAGGYLTGGFPMGDWGKIAGFGLGVDATDVVRKPQKALAWRLSTGVLYNFSRTEDVPQQNLASANDKLSLETKNWSLTFGIGPELSKPGPVSPFIFGTVGFDTYWTSSTLKGTANSAPFEAEHGDSRIAFAWAAGLGLRRTIMAGHLGELSVEYRSGDPHKFVLPDEVTNKGTPNNGVVANRDSHTSDQILIRFGTVFGE
jgi:opacity protein-like surface antigen